MSIEVEDDRGKVITVALVGTSDDIFEIRIHPDGFIRYYVDQQWVTAEVYRDCLETAKANLYCHECEGVHPRCDAVTFKDDDDDDDESVVS